MHRVEEREPDGTDAEGGGRHRRPVRLALVANHKISVLRLAMIVYPDLYDLPAKSTVLLRSPRKGDPGLFEQTVARMATDLGHDVDWYMPDGNGRDQTYRRDYEMVSAADLVQAYFWWEAPMEGGTGHIVEAALSREIPVAAWTVDDLGRKERLGEFTPDDPYGNLPIDVPEF